jgi:hypothetical protein
MNECAGRPTPDACLFVRARAYRSVIAPVRASTTSEIVRDHPSSVRRPETEPPFVRSLRCVCSFELKIPRRPSTWARGRMHANGMPKPTFVVVHAYVALPRRPRRPRRRRRRRPTCRPCVLNPLKRPSRVRMRTSRPSRLASIDSCAILSTGRVEYDVRTRSGASSVRV